MADLKDLPPPTPAGGEQPVSLGKGARAKSYLYAKVLDIKARLTSKTKAKADVLAEIYNAKLQRVANGETDALSPAVLKHLSPDVIKKLKLSTAHYEQSAQQDNIANFVKRAASLVKDAEK